MPFQRPALDELIARILTDLQTRLSPNNVVMRRSAIGAQAYAEAGAVHLLHGHLEYLSRQMFPDISDAEFLDRQASLFGITRTPATFATGNVTATGTNGTVIPVGTHLQRADGATFTSTANATIALGTATVAVTADVAGAAGNTDVAVNLTFVSPIAGVNASAAVAVGGLSLGADVESDDAFRAEVIARLRQSPQGGSVADYETWAMQVSGVTRVWVIDEGLGPGTVLIYFVRDGDGSGAAIIPDSGEVAAVQSYIDSRRPVTANVTVVAPTSVALNFTIHLSPDNTDTRAAAQAELVDLIARDGTPGGTILLSQIRVAVGVADGVADFNVTAPAADVVYTAGHIPVMGTITWT